MAKRKQPGSHKARWRRRLGPLAVWGPIAAVVGVVVFLVVYAATSGGGGNGDSSAQVAETASDPSKGQPFQGGPRLYSPVESMDLGQVPYMQEVYESFDVRNVGDQPLSIEDVQVTMLEGC